MSTPEYALGTARHRKRLHWQTPVVINNRYAELRFCLALIRRIESNDTPRSLIFRAEPSLPAIYLKKARCFFFFFFFFTLSPTGLFRRAHGANARAKVN